MEVACLLQILECRYVIKQTVNGFFVFQPIAEGS